MPTAVPTATSANAVNEHSAPPWFEELKTVSRRPGVVVNIVRQMTLPSPRSV
jgi:hypothetical protein